VNISNISNMQIQLALLGQGNPTGSSSGFGQLLGLSSTSSSSDTVTQLLAPANKRLSQQLESTKVQLSAYGQIKSAFSGVETAAGGLVATAASKTASNAEVVKAAQAFVNSYNQAIQAVGSAIQGTGTQSGALASDIRAKRAGGDLTQALTSGSGLANLKSAGITQNNNGTLSLNATALEQALQSSAIQTKSALTSIGQQLASSAGRELANSGNVGIGVNSLTSKSQSLSAQQTILQQQASYLQSALDRQSAMFSYSASNGIAAYQSLLLLR
jgi:hypothetical protein